MREEVGVEQILTTAKSGVFFNIPVLWYFQPQYLLNGPALQKFIRPEGALFIIPFLKAPKGIYSTAGHSML